VFLSAVTAATTIFVNATCAAPSHHPQQPTAIVDTTVINPRARTLARHVTVLVRGNHITAIQVAGDPPPRGFRRIDGRGRYIIPGLWDAHVHLSKLGPNSLPLFIANGVTGVRDMGSNLPELAAWRADIEGCRLLGPHILMSGPMIESAQNYERIRKSAGIEVV
jgi:hypothetical protein